MVERSDQIKEHLDRTRDDLQKNVNELQDRVKGAFDWRTQFEERPLLMLGLALGGGMLAAALLTRRRYVPCGEGPEDSWRAERKASWRAGRRENLESAFRGEAERETGSISESLGLVTGALMTSVASRIGGVLGQVLANYRDQLREAAARSENYAEREPRYPIRETESHEPNGHTRTTKPL
jgi:hypothetical protein